MKHSNIALFVAGVGCPHRCTFCDQRTITGEPETASPEDVAPAVRTALESGTRGAQLAFFGGSFTAVPRPYMISLLEAARPFVEDGSVSGIRISTRPDSVGDEVLDILEDYGVEAVELGAQSMRDRVLKLNRRGHTADDVVEAAERVRRHGFELGLQMMTGLPGSAPEDDLYTGRMLAELQPATMRIYPTIVLEGTELAELWRTGAYVPPTLDESVQVCGELLRIFEDRGIPVIRMGLHSGGEVEEGYLTGPYHPAFRELCEGHIYLERAKDALKGAEPGKYRLSVAPSEISKMAGQNRRNIIELEKNGYVCRIRPEDGLAHFEVRAEQI